MDPAIPETPKKLSIAYKISQNTVCMEVKKQRVTLYLKLDPKSLKPLRKNARYVTEIGHYGTGDYELNLESENDVTEARTLIEFAYRFVGG